MKNSSFFGLLLTLLAFFGCEFAFAAEGVIYQPVYRLKLSEKEEIPFRDYITSVGSRQGVQVGEVVEIIRAVPAFNDLWGSVSPLLEVVLGEAEVIAVSPAGSIVRMVRQNTFEKIPVMQYARFMTGDSVRTKNSFAKQD